MPSKKQLHGYSLATLKTLGFVSNLSSYSRKVHLNFSFSLPRLVLRIATDDSKAVCQLSVKFGATMKACRGLLERAMELGLDVIGVSFHVGSGCTDPETYNQAISDARCVFDMGVSVFLLGTYHLHFINGPLTCSCGSSRSNSSLVVLFSAG
jgi:hypothetical protein